MLFVQSVLAKFQVHLNFSLFGEESYSIVLPQLTQTSFKLGNKSLPTDLLRFPGVSYPAESLSGDNLVAFNAWFKALFDSSSEGIEDTILR